MNTAARFVCIVLALTLAACTGGGDMADMAETEGRIDFGRNTSFDGEVLRIEFERVDGTVEEFSTVRDRWYSWSWVPFLSNHSGRRWTLLKTDPEGSSLAYALVSWNNDDATDYLAAGFWMRFDGFHPPRLPISQAETRLFIDGPEIDSASPPELPLTGTADYAGSAGGVYLYRYGSDWTGNEEPVSAEEFMVTMTVRANFDDMTVAGCIGCIGDIRIEREHLYLALGRRTEQPLAMPTDYEIRFAPTPISPKGNFEGAQVAVTHPTRSVTQSEGDWGGSLSNRPAADGSPRLVAGFAGAEFEEADGSRGAFSSIFTGLHPSLLPAPRQ